MSHLFVYASAGAAALALLPFVVRTPRPVSMLVSSVDEDLLSRVALALFLPSPDRGAAVWLAIGEWRGIPHLISQSRLLLKIVIESRKETVSREEAARIETELWPALRMAWAESLLESRHAARSEALRLGMAVSELGRAYRRAVESIDSPAPDAVS